VTEINKKILDLIEKNASVNEISKITGLTNKQLFYRLSLLKNKGYDFERKYYYSGDIVYRLIRDKLTNDIDNNGATILTSKNDNVFKALLISDLHIVNKNERLDFIYKTYDYCIKDENNTKKLVHQNMKSKKLNQLDKFKARYGIE